MYCIGCSDYVCDMALGQVMAISCRCGAAAPILISGDGKAFAPPASYYTSLITPRDGLHFEYYLGYSEHTSPAKDLAMGVLRYAGATSQRDCKEPECQRAVERQLRRLKKFR